MSHIKIMVVEDEPLILEDICDTLEDLGYAVAVKTMDGEVALDALKSVECDLVLLDINLGGDVDGITIGQQMHDNNLGPFIYLTSYGDRATIDRAKATRPMTYLMKPYSEESLLSAIEIALYNYSKIRIPAGLNLSTINGQILGGVTEREFDVLEALFEGKTNKLIAESQFISPNTVKSHIKNLFSKFDVHSRTELLAALRVIMSKA